MHFRNGLLLAFAFELAGCSMLDGATRSSASIGAFNDEVVYLPDGLSVHVHCIRIKDRKPDADPKLCDYRIADDNLIGGADSPFLKCAPDSANCAAMRNELIDLLVNLSDRNCATFMQRMFIAKSTSDSSYSFARDALTGGAAAAAAPAPIAAVGLGFGSLLLRSWESVDKTFFLNSAYQSLESAIQMERDSRMTDLRNQCRMPSEGGTVAYGNCTIHEAMRLVGRYGDACSLRAGVGKLQSLVHAQEEAEATRQLSDEKLRLEKAKTQLEKELAELRSDASRQVALSEIATKMQQVTVALDSIAERQAAQTEQITKLENNPPGATSEPVP